MTTAHAEVASAIAAARARRQPAVQPPATLFDPPPPAHTLHHKDAGTAELRAAQRALHNATSWKGRVWRVIRDAGPTGVTTLEIHAKIGGAQVVDFETIQPRTTDLKRDGLICRTDELRTVTVQATGRSHDGNVWVATEYRKDHDDE